MHKRKPPTSARETGEMLVISLVHVPPAGKTRLKCSCGGVSFSSSSSSSSNRGSQAILVPQPGPSTEIRPSIASSSGCKSCAMRQRRVPIISRVRGLDNSLLSLHALAPCPSRVLTCLCLLFLILMLSSMCSFMLVPDPSCIVPPRSSFLGGTNCTLTVPAKTQKTFTIIRTERKLKYSPSAPQCPPRTPAPAVEVPLR